MTLENDTLQAEPSTVEPVAVQAVDPSGEAPGTNEDNGTNDNGEQKSTFDEGQQKVFNDAIGKKVGQTRAAERERDAALKALEDFKAKIPAETRPDVPDLPDKFSDTYDQDVLDRDQKVKNQATFDARQEVQKDETNRKAQEVQQQQVQAIQTQVNTYTERAGKLGISSEDLKAAGEIIKSNGISDRLTLHILGDEQGPAITTYLAKNPIVLDQLHGMSDMQAAVHLENVVKPSVSSSKKTTAAPSPTEMLEGGGSPPKSRGPAGATYS